MSSIAAGPRAPSSVVAGVVRVLRRTDLVLAAIVFLFSYSVFHRAPIQQPGDSRYSMLLTENILRHGDLALERYHLPEPDYRLQWVAGHQYYFFPVGTSILSIPFVAAMHWRHVSAVRPDGRYDVSGELALDSKLADLLMAAFVAVVYLSARLLLPELWSIGIAAIAASGTQVFSTLSRSMWSDTWGTLLLGMAGLLLLRSHVRSLPLSLPLLATLESWAYVVRPTSAIVLAGTAFYVVANKRRDAAKFLLVVAGWIGLFFVYSWWHFHKLLPDYYAASRLQFDTPALALFGNLASPSRGLLVYVPAVVAVALLAARYRHAIRFRGLAALAAAFIVTHLVMLSGFVHWWGGHCYGARLTASLVPWIVVLSILVADAMRTSLAGVLWRGQDYGVAGAAGLLCFASVVINTIGAFSQETAKWNSTPANIDEATWRLWDWHRPQFLAPFVEPNGPFPSLPSAGLAIGAPEVDKYLGLGWAYGEGAFRWTEGSRGSTVRFSLPAAREGTIELELRVYLAAPKLLEQRLIVSINGHDLDTVRIGTPDFATYSFIVPAEDVKSENVLRLRAPDAMSPFDAERASDRRVLGVAVRRFQWRECGILAPQEVLPTGGTVVSCDGRFALTMARDGDLVLRGCLKAKAACPCWHSDTSGHSDAYVVMQDDGNLVILGDSCRGDRQSCWSSASFGHPNAFLAVQDDGRLCVVSGQCAGENGTCWCGGGGCQSM